MNLKKGIAVCLALILRCCHHDNRCHGCRLTLYNYTDILACCSESVIYRPTLNHVAAIAEYAKVDDIIIFWYALAEGIYVFKAY